MSRKITLAALDFLQALLRGRMSRVDAVETCGFLAGQMIQESMVRQHPDKVLGPKNESRLTAALILGFHAGMKSPVLAPHRGGPEVYPK